MSPMNEPLQQGAANVVQVQSMAKAGRRPRLGEQERFMLFLIAPAAVFLLLFQVLPIVIGANASFRDWSLNNPRRPGSDCLTMSRS